ncbi:diguanylate cyclase [Maridesulfovibrio sp. FT414]|uniref:diguanylate cyclase n=1 Tax=Maridesulfovibrio sp. FT414 TaxID=2979469 RepID=UPI003D8089BF
MNTEHLKHKILIVDDAPANIKLLGAVLREDYRIAVARDGMNALEIAASEDSPDLILLDIVMPEIDGYEVCRRLKKNPATQNIPVIFITSRDQVEDEAKGLELGAVDYITKPFSLPIVKVRVKTQLELKRQRDMLMELSVIDPLTGLPNRRQLEDRLALEWQRARRHGSSLCAAFIDIDYFKKFNDTQGHAKGDECLRLVARELAGNMKRSTDLLVRYGGEEFVALFPDTDIDGGMTIAENLRAGIQGLNIEHHASDKKIVTVSIGVSSMIPGHGNSSELLLEAADRALYQAKDKGRNRIEAYTEQT